jgi:hypothetical protein
VHRAQTPDDLLGYCKIIQDYVDSPQELAKPIKKLVKKTRAKKAKPVSKKEVAKSDTESEPSIESDQVKEYY